jgi:hypothetical protein
MARSHRLQKPRRRALKQAERVADDLPTGALGARAASAHADRISARSDRLSFFVTFQPPSLPIGGCAVFGRTSSADYALPAGRG